MSLLPVLSGLSKLAARSFYRLQVVGPEVPEEGSALLFANHPNSLLDPALVAAAAGRPVRFLAKSTLFSNRRVGWLVRAAGAIPVYRRSDEAHAADRNVEMFEAVYEELGKGAAIGIFPEGISHSLPSLAQLRTGTARIALGAAQRGTEPYLVPVGLLLREKGIFRSEAVVIRGEPVDWSDLSGRGVDDRAAVRELTARLEEGLREVTMNLERWQDRPLVDCVEAIWTAELAGEAEDDVDRLKRAQTVAAVLSDLRRRGEPGWQELARQVSAHRRRLTVLGLEPRDLGARLDLGAGAGWTLRRLPLVVPPVGLVGLLGAAIFWLPYWVTDRVVRVARPDPDQSSTYKVLVGALVYLAWIALIGVGTWWQAGPWPAATIVLVLPFLGLAGQWVRERWRGAWRDVRRFFLLRSRQELGAQLKAEQAELASRLESAYGEWQQRGSPAG